MDVVTVKSVQVKRSLPVQLTDSEKRDYGRKLADLEFGKRQIEYEKKVAMEWFKDQLTATELAIDDTSNVLRAGSENRDVVCRWSYDWMSMMKRLMREDTGEIVETAIIQPEERQMDLSEETQG